MRPIEYKPIEEENKIENKIEELKTEIIKVYGDYKKTSRLAIEKAVHLGGLLVRVKEEVGHGNFQTWIAENMPFTYRTARNYMDVYEVREKINPECDILTEIYRLKLNGREPEPESLQPEPPVEEWTLPNLNISSYKVEEPEEPEEPKEPIKEGTHETIEVEEVDWFKIANDQLLDDFKKIFLKLDNEHKRAAIDWLSDWEHNQTSKSESVSLLS